MASVDWSQLLKEMLVVAGSAAHEHGAEVALCLEERLRELAKLAAETANDYLDGYITEEQYRELNQNIEKIREWAIEDCVDFGRAVVQAAVNAAIDKLWATLNAAVGKA